MTHVGEVDITIRMLRLIASERDEDALVREAVEVLRDWSGCDAVGIRLRDGDDYPYREARGFPPDFVAAENRLCEVDAAGNVVRDASGHPMLACMCGNVIRGRFDPSLPYFTPAGSFWTNSTTTLLASSTEAERQGRTRNRCNGEGYESVALIPLGHGDQRVGLLQFNRRAPGRFDAEMIALIEELAAGLAFGILQRREADVVKASQRALRALLDAADESVVLLDEHGCVVAANQLCAERLGIAIEDLLGHDIYSLVPPGLAGERQAQIEHARQTGHPVRFTDQRDGVWFEHSLFPVKNESGRVTSFAIYSRDISARVRTDRELRAAEERYRTIIDASPLFITLVRDGRYTYANPAAAKRFGVSAAEIVGLPIEAVIHPRDVPMVHERQRNVLDGRTNPPARVTMVMHDAAEVIVEYVSVPILLHDGPAILAMGQDITDRVAAEETLRLQALVLDQIHDQVTVTDLDGRITYANDAVCRCLHRPRQELIGASVQTYGDDASRGATQAEIISRTLLEGRWRGDVVNQAADGGALVLDCRTHVVRDQEGAAIAMCGISTDITESRRVERELRESEERFRMLYESLPAGYQSLDVDGRLLDANPAWLEALGYARDEVIGRDFAEFLAPEEVPKFRENFPKFKALGAAEVEFVMLRKDGTPVTMYFIGRVGRDRDGGFVQTHCICTDVTRMRDLEQQYRQAQKMEAVGRLAAGVAHDFNNQLTVIRGYADMLLADYDQSSRPWRPLTEIMRAAERAQATTSHLLSFSRKQMLDPQFVDLGELLAGFRNPVGTLIGEDIRLSIDVANDLPTVLIDRAAMQQALMNLVVNARDAMATGGDLALVARAFDLDDDANSRHPELQPGPHVVVEVRDTGCGMDDYTLERLFEPFFTTKPTGKGTGLGMPMVLGFVQQSHGAIEVDSAPNGGTTIRVILPAAGGAECASIVGPVGSVATLPGGNESVLVVEDAAAVRGMVVTSLTRAGYDVWEASGPEDALAVIARRGSAPDLLVTDIVMPGMSGVDLANVLTARHAGLRVLYISGYHEEDVHGSAADVLLKPFGPAELARRVRRALDCPAPASASANSSCPRLLG